jgi:two-component sensor histidine kinase
MRADGQMESVQMRVPLTAAAASAVRHAIADALDGQVADRAVADAQLILSELVTNSLRHAGLGSNAILQVAASVRGGMLRLEVADDGTSGTLQARAPGVNGGFGLNIVQMLAHSWGVEREGMTRVWVEMLAWPRPPD